MVEETSTPPDNSRDSRQRSLVPPAKLAEINATVVGVGAIGRQVALQLASVGVPKLTLIDPDTVNTENLATQGWPAAHLERPKVNSCAVSCHDICVPGCQIEFEAKRFGKSSPIGNVVFCCVDSMTDRKSIWEIVYASATAELFIDGRMSAEVIRVLAAELMRNNNDASFAITYGRTLFADSEAFEGSCTAKTTIYTANIAAGLMVHQMTRWMRGMPTTPDLLVNLLSDEMMRGST